jgi:hypothetical protein
MTSPYETTIHEFFIGDSDIALAIPCGLSSIPYSSVITISSDQWGDWTWYYQSQKYMLRSCLRSIVLLDPTSKVDDCCLAQSWSNYFRTPSDVRRNVPESVHRCCIAVYCMRAKCPWWQRLHWTSLADIRGTWCFFGDASRHIWTISLFQTDHSVFYYLLIQMCSRSTFILLAPSHFRILYFDGMPEFLPQNYSTWCWITS